MKKLIIILCISFLLSDSHGHDFSCGTINYQNRNFDRMEYAYPEYIDSEHFRVHFTSEAADSFFWNDSWMTHQSNIVYATTLLNQAEYAYLVYENNGWAMPSVDCDDTITDILNSDHCNHNKNQPSSFSSSASATMILNPLHAHSVALCHN